MSYSDDLWELLKLDHKYKNRIKRFIKLQPKKEYDSIVEIVEILNLVNSDYISYLKETYSSTKANRENKGDDNTEAPRIDIKKLKIDINDCVRDHIDNLNTSLKSASVKHKNPNPTLSEFNINVTEDSKMYLTKEEGKEQTNYTIKDTVPLKINTEKVSQDLKNLKDKV